MRTILKNATVIDGTGAAAVPNSHVVIKGNRIESISSAPPVHENTDRVLDVSGSFVLPGLWAVHTHLGAVFPDAKGLTRQESVADRTIRSGRNVMDALRAGFTGLRVVGERDGIDLAWKRAFDMGVMAGPNIYTCGTSIIATGVH